MGGTWTGVIIARKQLYKQKGVKKYKHIKINKLLIIILAKSILI